MDFQLFLKQIIQQHKSELPFVAYRKANQSLVKAILQKNDNLFTVQDFTENGFLFAPFNDKEPTVLIPFKGSNIIEGVFNNITLLGQSRETTVVSTSDTDEKKHINLVEKGISEIASGKFEKVVLSRRETVGLNSKSVCQLFSDLLHSYPTAFVYCWYHPKVGLWLGATPETLLKVENKRLTTMALAGTQEYKGDLNVIWGEKEKEEQKFVTRFISDNLKPFVDNLKIGNIQTIKAGNLLHLQTQISANLKGYLKSIIAVLHPTPAVCGLPKETAKIFILNNENHQRKFYTGYLGELNIKETKTRNRNKRNVENNVYNSIKTITDLYVNLRCMEIVNNEAHIFVGGGITKDSKAKDEWQETIAKSATMKKVLQ